MVADLLRFADRGTPHDSGDGESTAGLEQCQQSSQSPSLCNTARGMSEDELSEEDGDFEQQPRRSREKRKGDAKKTSDPVSNGKNNQAHTAKQQTSDSAASMEERLQRFKKGRLKGPAESKMNF